MEGKFKKWLGRKDSNLRPTIPKTVALPTELHPNMTIDLITILTAPVNNNLGLLMALLNADWYK